MKDQFKSISTTAMAAIFTLTVSYTTAALGDSLLYYDTFSRGTPGTEVALNGSTPDVTMNGATWTAPAEYKTDGTDMVATGLQVSAWIPFTPEAGNVYTLTLDFEMIAGSTWGGFGFITNANTGPFLSGKPAPWTMMAASEPNNMTLRLGPGADNVLTQIGDLPQGDGFQTHQIILDTRPALWEVQFTMNGTNRLANPAAYTTNPSIIGVGFGVQNHPSDHIRVDNFSLAITATDPDGDKLIYDTFSRGTPGTEVALNGSTPDVTMNDATWTAHAGYKTDGRDTEATGRQKSAWIAFTPETGHLYALTLDFEIIDGGSWGGFGFITNANTAAFTSGKPAPWTAMWASDPNGMTLRLGPSTANVLTQIDDLPQGDGFQTHQIILDTRPALWEVQFTMNGTNRLANPAAYTTNPSIIGVGFGMFNDPADHIRVDNFSVIMVPPRGTLIVVR